MHIPLAVFRIKSILSSLAELFLLSGLWNLNSGWSLMAATKHLDDSWEVRAFTEDTNDALGTTWPPRSYACTFCFREFRSAQALGGHMNVHRRHRAQLCQYSQGVEQSPSPSTLPRNVFPFPDVQAGAELGLYYPGISDYAQSVSSFSSTSLNIEPTENERATHNLISGMAGWPLRGDEQEFSIPDVYDGGVVDETDLELRLGR